MFCYITGFIFVFFLAKFLLNKRKKVDTLQKIEWKKDVVYLVQFPISPKVRTISPFALKLETWLRMTGIPYENIYDIKMSKKGQIPYIELNGQQIPDSNLAIIYLKKYFKETYPKVVEEDERLNEMEKALAHLTKVTMENHTCLAGFHYRYVQHMEDFFSVMMSLSAKLYQPIALKFFRHVTPLIVKLRLYLHGLGRHSPSEIAQLSSEDLDAMSRILGDKKFYLGDFPTSIDCTLYGHLAQFLYIPIDFPQKFHMRENCRNLVDYVDRMKSEFWPDWDKMCQTSCMRGHLGKSIAQNESKLTE